MHTPGQALLVVLLAGLGNAVLALALAWLLMLHWQVHAWPQAGQLWAVWLHAQDDASMSAPVQASVAALQRLQALPPAGVRLALVRRTLRPVADGRSAEPQMWLQVSPGFWSLLHPPLQTGSPPAPDSGQVVLTAPFARDRCPAAMGSHCLLQMEGRPLRVSGVLAADALAPLPLLQQQGGSAVAGYETRTDPLGGLPRQARVEAVLLARSDLPRPRLRARLQRQVAALGIEVDGRPLQVRVQPLVDFVRAGLVRPALVLAMVAAFAWAVQLLVLWMLLIARFGQHGHEQFVLAAVGVPPRDVTAYARSEARIAAGLVAAVSLLAVLALLALLAQGGWLPAAMRIGTAFVALAAASWLSVMSLWVMGGAARASVRIGGGDAGLWRNARGSGLAGWRNRFLQALQGLLYVLAAIALAWAVPFALRAWADWQAARQLRPADLLQLQVQFPPGLPAAAVLDSADRLSAGLARLPGLHRLGVGSLAPLDLATVDVVHYAGPAYAEASELVGGRTGEGGDYVLRIRGDAAARSQHVDYTLSIGYAEPAFLQLLRFRRLQGHGLDAIAGSEALLDREAAAVLFPGRAWVTGQRVPGPVAAAGVRGWHNHRAVAGVVEIARMRADAREPLASTAVAFLPLRELPTLEAGRPRTLYWLLRANPTAAAARSAPAIARTIAALPLRPQAWRLDALSDLVRRRLHQAILASLGSLLLALLIGLQFLLAVLALARIALQARLPMLAVHLAVGADPVPLGRQETLHLLRATLWSGLGLSLAVAAGFALGMLDGGSVLRVTLAACALALLSAGMVHLLVRAAVVRAPGVLLRDAR